MKYKITVVRIKENEPATESRYSNTEEIYSQTVEDLNVSAVISAINFPPNANQAMVEAQRQFYTKA